MANVMNHNCSATSETKSFSACSSVIINRVDIADAVSIFVIRLVALFGIIISVVKNTNNNQVCSCC